MQSEIARIREIIGQEVGLFKRLLEIAAAEREVLLTRERANELPALAEAKVKVCQDLAALQEERRGLLGDIFPQAAEPPKLSDLTPLLPPEDRAPFKETLRAIRVMAERLEDLNSGNRGFLEEALETVEHLLGILTGRFAQRTYAPQGRAQAKGLPRLLTREV